MAKQSKAKKSENLGKGTVTPVQIAFLVNQFLFDNSYIEACFVFRTEASSLFSKSPIQEAKQGGQIGWSLVGHYVEPYSDTEEDKAAAKRILDSELGWFMEPIVLGDYPKIMRDLVKERLSLFTEEEKKLIKGSFDFIGINYYTMRYGKNVPASQAEPLSYHNDTLATSTETNANGVLIGPHVRELVPEFLSIIV